MATEWVVILLGVGVVGLVPANFGMAWFGGIVLGTFIVGVEFTVPDGSHIRVKPGETTGANRYMTPQRDQGTYRDGIRIERMDDDPVYVGTERPADLAELIVERTPHVERAEPFRIEGPQMG